MSKVPVTLGVDIGGTNSALGLVDRQGAIVADMSIPTHAEQPASVFFRRLSEAAAQLFQSLSASHELAGIGIGAPNANFYKGTIEAPPNLSWGTINVPEELRPYFQIPVAITNDANAAAIGEMLFGTARGMRDFIVITLGTGLGSGIVANGELIYGADGFAGEIGHVTVSVRGRVCGCGRRGCLETYASATGICRTVMELQSRSLAPSELRGISYRDLTSKMIWEAALRGDAVALEAFEYTGKILGMKLAESVAHVSPEAIILFGGLSAAGDLITAPTKRSLEEHVFGAFRNKVKILVSTMTSGNAAVIGAGALIWKELERTR